MTVQQYAEYVAAIAAFRFLESAARWSAVANAEPFFSHQRCECCKRRFAGDRWKCNVLRTDDTIGEYDLCRDCVYYGEYGRLDDETMTTVASGGPPAQFICSACQSDTCDC